MEEYIKIKTIDGRRYFLRSWSDEKRTADRIAMETRTKFRGSSVRVEKAKSKNDIRVYGKYLVWQDIVM